MIKDTLNLSEGNEFDLLLDILHTLFARISVSPDPVRCVMLLLYCLAVMLQWNVNNKEQGCEDF